MSGDDAVDDLIRRTRTERGLPPRIEDPTFYRTVATAMARPRRAAAPDGCAGAAATSTSPTTSPDPHPASPRQEDRGTS